MRIFAILWLILVLSSPLAAGEKEDVQAIINGQIEAFQKDDFAAAFTYASPSIRSMFGTPENFGKMVQRGYPMVWRPKDVRFLDFESTPAGLIQSLQIVDQSGKVHYLRYFVVSTSKGWKISGVQFINPAEFSA